MRKVRSENCVFRKDFLPSRAMTALSSRNNAVERMRQRLVRCIISRDCLNRRKLDLGCTSKGILYLRHPDRDSQLKVIDRDTQTPRTKGRTKAINPRAALSSSDEHSKSSQTLKTLCKNLQFFRSSPPTPYWIQASFDEEDGHLRRCRTRRTLHLV